MKTFYWSFGVVIALVLVVCGIYTFKQHTVNDNKAYSFAGRWNVYRHDQKKMIVMEPITSLLALAILTAINRPLVHKE